MMGLETIKALNEEKARECQEKGILPLQIFDDFEAVKKIPHIGDFRPESFEKVNEFFVDSSDLGQSGEASLTFNEFCDKITFGRYYAIIEAGQFQVRIAEFIMKGGETNGN